MHDGAGPVPLLDDLEAVLEMLGHADLEIATPATQRSHA
jgi:hypothetical protein